MPQGKGTYGSKKGRPPMKTLSETNTKDSLLSKFKKFMSLKNINKRVQEAAKTPKREKIVKVQAGKPKKGSPEYAKQFKKEFMAARRAGKDSFVFSLDGEKKTTQRQDELDKLEKVGPNQDMGKAYREIRIKTGDFGKGKSKSKSKTKSKKKE